MGQCSFTSSKQNGGKMYIILILVGVGVGVITSIAAAIALRKKQLLNKKYQIFSIITAAITMFSLGAACFYPEANFITLSAFLVAAFAELCFVVYFLF